MANPLSRFWRIGLLHVGWCALTLAVSAQSLTVSSWAGSFGNPGFADGSGSAARFSYGVAGMATDSTGNLYIIDSGNALIREISPSGVVSTIAGQLGVSGDTDGTGSGATFNGPRAIAVAPNGNLYVAEGQRIRVVTPAGVVTTLAVSWDLSDAQTWLAAFDGIMSLAIDSNGTLYVTDFARVLRITPGGTVTTLAGQPFQQGCLDGIGDQALFVIPDGIAVDAANNLYVIDSGANNVRKVTPSGSVTTIAGQPGYSILNPQAGAGFADGLGVNARFNAPLGIVADALGNLYIADGNNHAIRRVSANGNVTTVAGGPVPWSRPVFADGVGYNVGFGGPTFLAISPDGTLYIGDTAVVRKGVNLPVSPVVDESPQSVTEPAGDTATFRVVADGNPSVLFQWQQELSGSTSWTNLSDGGNVSGTATAVLTLGDVGPTLNGASYRCQITNGSGTASSAAALLAVAPPVVVVPLQVTTVAGQPGANAGSQDGPVSVATFTLVEGIAVDRAGNVYVSDNGNHKIRKISSNGTVSTLAGSGIQGFADGSGASAQFSWPSGLTVDGDGNVYVADSGNGAIRRITPAGAVTTLSLYWDGIPTGNLHLFSTPVGIVIDASGDLFVTDSMRNGLYKISPSGVASIFAVTAQLNDPGGLAIDSNGDLFVADGGNQTIREITQAGKVTTLAGLAGTSGATDGFAASARFNGPSGVAVDSSGAVYVADWGNYAIRKISPGGIVSTVAGMLPSLSNPNSGGSSNGIGMQARFNHPSALAVDPAGDVFIADSSNYSVREGVPVNSVAAGQSVVMSALSFGGSAPAEYQWLKSGSAIAGATGSSFSLPAATPVDAGSYSVQVVASDGVADTSDAVPVAVTGGHLVNISARAQAGAGSQVLVAGFTVAGTGMPLLVRGVGPTLSQFGVSTPLLSPQLTLYGAAPLGALATNSGWADSPLLADAASRVCAFALPAGSLDAAILPTVGTGSMTAQVGAANSANGVALVEIYDAGLSPACHLTNLSARGQVGVGQNLLVAGFSIGGTTPLQLLIRGIGPTLTQFGVSGVLADPEIKLYDASGTVIAQNDNWGDGGQAQAIASAAQEVWAFALPSGSKDAAMLVTLQPGLYTVQVDGVGGATGVALAELYEVP